MLVIPELEQEVKLLSESKSTRKVCISQLLVKKMIPSNEMLYGLGTGYNTQKMPANVFEFR